MDIAFSVLLILPIFLTIIIGLSFLQVYLSKKNDPSPGMILPTIFLVLGSLTTTLAAINTTSTMNFGKYLVGIIFSFLFYNLPTIIYLLIYTACRKNLKSKKEIKKMNIIDLD